MRMVMVMVKMGDCLILYIFSHRCHHICLLHSVLDSDAVLKMRKPTGGMLTRKGVVHVTSRGLATA